MTRKEYEAYIKKQNKDSAPASSHEEYERNLRYNNMSEDERKKLVSDIYDRARALAEGTEGLASDFRNRYKNGNTTYRADAGRWLSHISDYSSRYDAEYKEVSKLLDDYGGLFDEKWVNDLRATLKDGSKYVSDVVSSAKTDNDFWSQFKTESEYRNYIDSIENPKQPTEEEKNSQKTWQAYLDYDPEQGQREIDDLYALREKIAQISHPTNPDDIEKMYAESDPLLWENIKGVYENQTGLWKPVGLDENLNTVWELKDGGNNSKTKTMGEVANEVVPLYKYGYSLKMIDSEIQRRKQYALVAASMKNVDTARQDPNFDKIVEEGAADEYNSVAYAQAHKSSENTLSPTGIAPGYDVFGNKVSTKYSLDADDFASAQYMTEDEAAIYNYFYAKEKHGEIASGTAQAYFDAIKYTLNSRSAQETFKNIKDNWFKEILFGIEAGFDQFKSGIKSLFNTSDDYIQPSATQIASSMVRGDMVKQGWLAQTAYDAATTTANMIPSIGASILVGTVSKSAGAWIGAGLMGASAAGNSYAAAINSGMDKGQARVYSTLVGLSEAGLQRLFGGIPGMGGYLTGKVVENVGEKVTKFALGMNSGIGRWAVNFGGFMLRAFGNAMGEAIEEFSQDVLDPYLKAFATGEAPEDIDWGQALYSGLLGGLSSFILGGAEAGVSRTAYLVEANSIKKSGRVADLVKAGKTFDAETIAYKLADQLGENPSVWKMATLLKEVNASIGEQTMTDIQNALEAQGVVGKDAKNISRWIAKIINDDSYVPTENQQWLLEHSDMIGNVMKTIIFDRNTTVNQRRSAWSSMRLPEGEDRVEYGIDRGEVIEKAAKDFGEYRAVYDRAIRRLSEGAIANNVVDRGRAARNTNGDAESINDRVKRVEAEFGIARRNVSENAPSVAKVESIDNGKLNLKYADGSQAAVSEAKFNTSEQAERYLYTQDSVDNLAKRGVNLSAQDVNFVVNAYSPTTGISPEAYFVGAESAIMYGYYGAKPDAGKNALYDDLTPTQQNMLYGIGEQLAAREREARVASRDRRVAAATSKKTGKAKVNTDNVSATWSDGTKIAKARSSMEKNTIDLATKMTDSGAFKNDIVFYRTENGKFVSDVVYNGETIWKKGEKAPNGMHRSSDGTIFVDLAAGNNGEGFAIQTLMHEIGHDIADTNPEAWAQIVDFYRQTVGVERFDALVSTKYDSMVSGGRYSSVSRDMAIEDVVCDGLGDMATKGDFVEKLTQYAAESFQNEAEANKFIQKVKDLFNRVLEALRKIYNAVSGTPAAAEISDNIEAVKKIADMAAKAYVEANDVRGQMYNTADTVGIEAAGNTFSIKNTQNISYDEQLRRLEDGSMNGSDSLYIGVGSVELQNAGFSNAPFAMNQSDYRKSHRRSAKNKHYSSHGVPLSFFENMPAKINSASMLIDKGDKTTIITDYQMNDTKGNPSYVIAGVHQNQPMENDTVNLVKSVYPLDDFATRIITHAENGELVVINKNKAERLLATIGVQPSKVSRILNLAKNSLSQVASSVNTIIQKNSINTFSDRDQGYAPVFYSQMAKVVDDIKTEKVGADSVIPYLRGRGVKAEEIKWSGIAAFLQGKKSVTKDDLQRFAENSMLRMEEKMLDTEYDPNVFEQYQAANDEAWNRGYKALREDGVDIDEDKLTVEYEDDVFTAYYDGERVAAYDPTRTATHWGKYAYINAEGGNNYREMLFKMPGSDYSNHAMDVHWGEKGVLAHARMQDMNTPEGRMLFVEEIQSDWHNEGKKRGYEGEGVDLHARFRAKSEELRRTQLAIEEALYSTASKDILDATMSFFGYDKAKAIDRLKMGSPLFANGARAKQIFSEKIRNSEAYKELGRLHDEFSKLYDEVQELGERAENHRNAAPDAPFRDNYTDFVMKRLLRLAAEEGYDSIGWTTSEQQSERWSDQYAEGYRIEYDQDIPKFMSKYGKQWGGTVTKGKIYGGWDTAGNGATVWQFIIPDAMKQSILTEGQPMFSERDESAPTNRELLTTALESTTTDPKERAVLNKYRDNIEKLNAKEAELKQKKAELKNALFTEGPRDQKQIKVLNAEVKQLENQLNYWDKKLMTALEASKPLRDVLYRERGKAYQRAKQADREMQIKRREDRASTMLRNSIKRIANDFAQRMQRPTDRRWIPGKLMQGVVDIAEMIDPTGKKQDSQSAQKYQNTKQALYELKNAYDELKKADDYDFQSEFDEEFSSMISDLAEVVGDTPVREMTYQQLQDVHAILSDIRNMIDSATKQIGKDETYSNYELGIMTMDEMEQMRDLKLTTGAVMDISRNWLTNPMRAVREMTGFKEDSVLNRQFKALDEGRVKADDFRMREQKKIDALRQTKADRKVFNDAVEKAYDFGLKDVDGNPLKISKMQAMQILLTYEREQANPNRKHLENDIFILDPELLAKGKIEKAFDKAQIMPALTPDALNKIVDGLNTEWDQKFMNVAREIFREDAPRAVNETTMQTKHRPVATEKAYIPYEVNKDFVIKENENVTYNAALENMGMLKSIMPNSTKPLYIRGLNALLDRHIDDVAKIYGLAIPVRNFNKVYNVTEQGNRRSVQAEIGKAWGKGGNKIISQAVADIQANRRGDEIPLFQKVKRGMVVAALVNNISVVIKQAASYPTAGAILSGKALAKGLGRYLTKFKDGTHAQDVWDEIDAHTPQHYTRRKGLSTQELGEFSQTKGWQNKVNNALGRFSPMKWIQGVDVATTAALWYACKAEVEMQGLTEESENYWDEVASLYNRVLEETQPMYDPLHRVEMSKNKIGQNVFVFQTQPMQNSGILRDGAMELRAAKKLYGKDSAEAKAASKKFVKAVASQTVSHLVFTAMSFIAAAMLHRMKPWSNDDDEVTWDSILKKFGVEFGKNYINALVPLVGNYGTEIAEKMIEGTRYDVLEDSVVGKINDTINAFARLRNPSFENFEDFMLEVASYLGVPGSNLKKVREGLQYHMTDLINGEFLSYNAGTERTTTQNTHLLYHAIMDGDAERVSELKKEFKSESAYHTAIRKALRENDLRIEDAARARMKGDIGGYTRIAKEIKAEGRFAQDDIVAAINAKITEIEKAEAEPEEDQAPWYENESADEPSSLYKIADINTALEGGDMNAAKEGIDDLVSVKMANGASEKDAKSSVRSGLTSYWKPIYLSASESRRAEIRTMLWKTGVYGSANDVVKACQKWVKDSKK